MAVAKTSENMIVPFSLLFVLTLLLTALLIAGLILHNRYMIITAVVGIVVQIIVLIYLCFIFIPSL